MTRSTLRLATTLLFAWVFSACPDPNQPCGPGLARGANGQCSVPATDLCNALQVSAGSFHTCAVVDPVNLCTENGASVMPTWPGRQCTVGREIRCWGTNNDGQLGTGDTSRRLTPTTVNIPMPQGAMSLRGFVQVVAGRGHTCALTVGGTVRCWGQDSSGQRGGSSTEIDVPDLSEVVELAAGELHTCARRTDGTVRCWGDNGHRQLGSDSGAVSRSPVAVAGLTGVVEIAAGGRRTCARLETGAVRCWGDNSSNMLGGSSTTTDVPGLANVVEIAAGSRHTCARLGTGTVRCWGSNSANMLGGSSTMRDVPGLTDAAEIAAGYRHTCARLVNGTVRCWGEDRFGEVGNSPTPREVPGVTNVVEITEGVKHTCGRLRDGTIRCWGENREFEYESRNISPLLGDGTAQARTGLAAPVLCCAPGAAACASGCVNLETDVENCGTCGNRCSNGNRCTAGRCERVPPARGGIAAGGDHTCALRGPTNARELVCWGSNFYGELGIPTNSARDRCRPVAGLSGVQQVVAGDAYFSCVLRTGGTVRCFGEDPGGQLGGSSVSQDIPGLDGVTALSAGGEHVCAIREGQVRCWGSSEEIAGSSTTTDIPGLDRVTALSASVYHTCAVREGRVRCWGDNRNASAQRAGSSTTTDIAGLDKVTAVAAGSEFTCALREDNNVRSVHCWGRSRDPRNPVFGPVEVSGLQGVTAIAARGTQACAVLEGGTVRCWTWGDWGLRDSSRDTTPLGTPTVVDGLRDVTELTMSREHTCARLLDDSVRCWGKNSFGQLGVPYRPTPGLETPVCVPGCETSAPTMSTTCGFTCVDTQTNNAHCGACDNRCTDGKVCMAGMCRVPLTCTVGQTNCTPTGCVDSQTDPRHCGNCMTACPVGQLCRAGVCSAATATRIAAGGGHTCVITDANEVKCWGNDTEGQRGDGERQSGELCSGPELAAGTPVEIAAGAAHTCVRMMGGTVHCWGSNSSGQLGNGSTMESSTPVRVMGLANAAELAAGAHHTCARTTDGAVHCWGSNGSGQLGNGSTMESSTPVRVMGLTDAVEIVAGEGHTCARRMDRTVHCWGGNAMGQLGIGRVTNESSLAPVAVMGLSDVVEIAAGRDHTCARLMNGEVRCWGSNNQRQLEADSGESRASPVAVTGLSNVVELSAGASHTCARRMDRTVHCWGGNGYGQLGNGSTTNSSTPVAVSGLAEAAELAAGEDHSCARTTGGAVYCWGRNLERQLGDGSMEASSTPVLALCTGAMGATCPTGQRSCGTPPMCVDTQTNASHCGGCGMACSFANAAATCANEVCALGACVTGFGNCDGDADNGCETNFNTSVSNCGVCGTVCTTMVSGLVPVCRAGTCGTTLGTCPSGRADCNMMAGDGCEVDTATTLAHCGGCGMACTRANAAATCSGGACVLGACDAGFGNCNMNAADGCETNTTNTAAHCGACNNVCPARTNAAATCTSGACGIQCNAGFANCNSNVGDGCEVSTQVDPVNCGGCGTVCNLTSVAMHTCAAGICGVGACAMGFGNCDTNPANGCETDTRSSAMNCGGCGMACSFANAAGSCANSVCALGACNTGFANCDMNPANGCETDTRSSAMHCGGCGMACARANAAATCSGGACVLGACSAGFGNCDGNATNGCETNTTNTNAHCGTCGNACGAGQACVNGACASTCPNTLCGMACVDLQTSVANCGACGRACALANVATHTCALGTCGVSACATGFGNCDMNPANGCETDTRASVMNCGTCGTVCSFANAAASCAGGSCALGACNAGFANCDNNAMNGCETDTRSSAMNCGGCGMACSFANAGATCAGGSCALGACNTGFANCDGNAMNGCEANTATSTANCGGCGMACARANAASTCSGGACVLGACSAGFGNCDGNAANGCETNTTNTNAHCGTCGNACGAGQACVNGACASTCPNTLCGMACVDLQTSVANCGACGRACALGNVATHTCALGTCGVGTCNTGFGNCNNNAADGCETNTTNTAAHCGACNNVCPVRTNAAATCASGACGITCNAGFANCNSNTGDGCEVSTQVDPANCGGCGTVCNLTNVAMPTCAAGTCGVGACTLGFGNCDGNAANGCETNTNTSAAHCGMCGRACAGGQTCSGGACVTPVTPPRPMAPLSTAIVTSQRPTLRWSLPGGATGARVQLCGNRACTMVESSTDVTGTSMQPMTNLTAGVHFWRLFPIVGGMAVTTQPSATWEFFVGARSAPIDTTSGSVSDFNGDGFADVAVRTSAGVSVYHGGASGVSTTPAASLTGSEPFSEFGAIVQSAGDVNGDGFADLVVGEPRANFDSGAAYVYLGGPTGITTTPAATIVDPMGRSTYLIGIAAAGAGDVNRDGFADLVVGAPGANNNGQVQLFLGSAMGIGTTPSAILDGPDEFSGFGLNLSAGGDLNGDGTPDLAVSAPRYSSVPGAANNTGRVYVYFGNGTAYTTPHAQRYTGSTTLSNFGVGLDGTGDVNGDGYSDLVLGAGGVGAGTVYVFHGGASGLASTASRTLADNLDPVASYGDAVSNRGDLNGDGYADLVVASAATAVFAGQAWIYVGGASGLSPTPARVLTGPTPMGGFGATVAISGTVNADGFGDVVIGVGTSTDTYIFHGSSTGIAGTATTTLRH